MQRLVTVLVGALLAVVVIGGAAMAGMGRSPSFEARATSAAPTERMKIRARVGHPDRDVDFRASAVVRFASGDVAVDLDRVNDGYVARGRLVVDADEAPGPVTVVVTMGHGESMAVLTFQTEVLEPEGSDDEPPADDPPPPEI